VTTVETLALGRESFRRQAWSEAYAHLSAADSESPLGGDDLYLVANAAYLLGKHDEAADYLTRAHQDSLAVGDLPRAARFAFWLGMALMNAGDFAPATGWFARGQRLLDEVDGEHPEHGYLLLPLGIRTLAEGRAPEAYAIFERAYRVAERFPEPDLNTLALLGRGRCLVSLQKTAEGLVLLDEVMVATTSDEVSPVVRGIVYCSVLEACHDVFDLRRAREWTAAMSHWCEAHPDMVPFRGECLIRRSEVMQLRGAWQDALEEAERARERLSYRGGQPALGAAMYQRAELHRLRGNFVEAEAAYREASRWGRQPEPGLALLRLAQGQKSAAAAAIRRALDEAQDMSRLGLLGPAVEILLAAGDIEAARTAAAELSRIAASHDAPLLHAISADATGAVLLAEGEARAALRALRLAWTGWQEIEAPYNAARARVLIGLACRALGDEDGAEMEFDAARWVFQQLGATPDLASAEALSLKTAAAAGGGLTQRELQVLRQIAGGKTNRAIAAELYISEKTVARHVSNIFTKLGLSSRAAATAYAYEHGLI
jgi:DNA-binding NarL/FixJ family response regulator